MLSQPAFSPPSPGLHSTLPRRALQITQWNIRGARANRSWLYNSLFSSSLIVALQETWLSAPVSFLFPGKISYRLDRPSGRGGGLLTAVSPSLPSRRIDLPLRSSPTEVLAIEVKLSPTLVLQVVNIYSPRGFFEQSWLDQLLALCKPPFLILGDFNVWHPAWGAPRCSAAGDVVANWIAGHPIGLLNIDTPTHVTRSASSLLDLSIASMDLLPRTSCRVHPDPFDSDHRPVTLSIAPDSPYSSRTHVRVRYNYRKLRPLLNASLMEDPPSDIESFQRKCYTCLQEGTETSTIRSRTGAPWWNSKCSYLLGQKRKFLRKARTWMSPVLWQKYKFYSAKLKREMRRASQLYWGVTCETAARTGKIYQLLRILRQLQSAPAASHHHITPPGNRAPTDTDTANAFAEVFSPLAPGCSHPPGLQPFTRRPALSFHPLRARLRPPGNFG